MVKYRVDITDEAFAGAILTLESYHDCFVEFEYELEH